MRSASGNDLKTFLLHRTAFLCVSRFLRLASFGTVNALMIAISVTFQPLLSVIPKIFHNFAACETSLKERFTTLSNKNPPERERFKGNLSTYKMCLGVPNHSYLPIDRMTLLLALSTTEESSRAK